jgi:hypothetical protein
MKKLMTVGLMLMLSAMMVLATPQPYGANSCFDGHRNVQAADMWETGLNPAFADCVAEHGNSRANYGRDFEGAERFWNNYEVRVDPLPAEFNPEIATYHWNLERALNR